MGQDNEAQDIKKAKKPIWKRWWFWALVVIVIIIAASGGDNGSNSGRQTVAPSIGENTDTIIEETKSEPKDYVEAGTALEIGKWVVMAGSDEAKIEFAKKLGSDYFGETADEGYTFALVPVFVKNNTKSTESLTFVTWTLEDDEGYSYSIQTMADIYLSEDERLNVTDVPPESIRYGYIIFQVRENVNDLYFGLETTLGNGKWHFKIN